MSRRAFTTVITFAALGFVVTRKGPAWKLRWRIVRAFRLGRRFYSSYPYLVKDIAYGDRPRQALDVYWPPDPGGALRQGKRLPVLLFAYGGSWSRGDKALYSLVGARFTALGFVVVVINYRLHPEVTFPAFVEDAAAAIAWTRRHIDAYHGDPDRIFVAGHSAGGHILTLVALDDRYLAAHGLPRSVVNGLIAVSAPTDLGAMLRHLRARRDHKAARGLQTIMGGPQALLQADPMRFVRSDTPPILLLHGVDDGTVPIAAARNFASALEAAGAPVELCEYERADHASILLDGVRDDPDRPASLLADGLTFVQQIGASLASRPQVDTPRQPA